MTDGHISLLKITSHPMAFKIAHTQAANYHFEQLYGFNTVQNHGAHHWVLKG